MRTWPSRRAQIIVMAALLIGALLRVFWVPLTRQGRAERLYEESWFVDSVSDLTSEQERHGQLAFPLLEDALRLSPGNSRFEQALVWQWESRRLPELLRNRQLGAAARRLAAARFCKYVMSSTDYSPWCNDSHKRWLQALECADASVKADPTNSLVYYRKAFCLQRLGRSDDAFAVLRTANRLCTARRFLPEAPQKIMASPAIYGRDWQDYSDYRLLAIGFIEVANGRLRHGDIPGACALLEECSRLSASVAAATPPTYGSIWAAMRIESRTDASLMPIYKDFSMKDRITRLQALRAAYGKAKSRMRTFYANWERQVAMPYVIPIMLIHALVAAMAFIALFVVALPLPMIVQKRHGQSSLYFAPWREEFLARIFALHYSVLFAGSIAVIYKWPGLLFMWGHMPHLNQASPLAVAAVLLMNLILSMLILRVLHHQYDAQTGERTGILRFIFKSPANVKAWTRRYLVAAFGAQILFILCCAMLATIVYKPIFGGHPWQENRFRIAGISHEQAIAKKLAADIVKADLPALPKQSLLSERLTR